MIDHHKEHLRVPPGDLFKVGHGPAVGGGRSLQIHRIATGTEHLGSLHPGGRGHLDGHLAPTLAIGDQQHPRALLNVRQSGIDLFQACAIKGCDLFRPLRVAQHGADVSHVTEEGIHGLQVHVQHGDARLSQAPGGSILGDPLHDHQVRIHGGDLLHVGVGGQCRHRGKDGIDQR